MGDDILGRGAQAAPPTDLDRAKDVFESVLTVIFNQIKQTDDGDADAARKTITTLADLNRAYLGVKEAERAFHEKHGKLVAGDIDFDALRTEIGRKLDRLRRARSAGGISGQPHE